MGNSINKIDDGFYICGVPALHPYQRLKDLGITSILNAAGADLYRDRLRTITGDYAVIEDLLSDSPPFDVKIVGADDAEDYNLSEHFAEIVDFIEAGRRKGGVVVHCAAGISRATTSCCAYLMVKEDWTLDAAFERIHTVRPFVHPNRGFWRQLRDFEASLRRQGKTLKDLPPGYAAPAQPPGSEESSQPRRPTRAVIEELDRQIAALPSFVTKFLVAQVEPHQGISTKELEATISGKKVDGVKWEAVTAGDTRVVLRAGLVPSMDSKTLHTVLSAVEGVKNVVCEGGV
jgi:hypothetical protein